MTKNTNFLVIFLILTPLGLANGSTSYHVGNSLTWDMLPPGLVAMAGEKGIVHDAGYHIRSGMGLNYIWDNPDDVTSSTSYGNYVTALSSYEWDNVVLQPYYKIGSTLGTDEQAFLDFINLTTAGPSRKTKFFIYNAWPSLQVDYQEYWDQDIPNDQDYQTTHARVYFKHLLANIKTKISNDVELYMIPVGEVFYEIDKKLRAGNYSGFDSINNFYRDKVHMRRDVGRFAVATTAFATLFRINPKGMTLPPTGFENPQYYFLDNGTTLLTNELRDLIQETVWEVVSYHVDTGIDITPNEFDTIVVTDARLGEIIVYGTYTIDGINAESRISISNGEYAINDNDFTGLDGVVFPGDSIKIRIPAPETYATLKMVTLNIGLGGQDFHVTTLDSLDLLNGPTETGSTEAGCTHWFMLLLFLFIPSVRRCDLLKSNTN